MEQVQRVEVPAYTEEWMAGDRFGTVTGYVKRTGMTWVRLDKSSRTRRFLDADLTYVDND